MDVPKSQRINNINVLNRLQVRTLRHYLILRQRESIKVEVLRKMNKQDNELNNQLYPHEKSA